MTARQHRRTGFALIELLAALSLLTLLSALLWPVVHQIILVNASTAHAVNCMVTQDDVMDRIRDDLQWARSLPETFGTLRSGDSCLLIGQENGVVRYTCSEETMTRQVLPTNGPTTRPQRFSDELLWTLPKTNVRFTIRNFARTRDLLVVEFETRVLVKTGKNEVRKTRYELLLP